MIKTTLFLLSFWMCTFAFSQSGGGDVVLKEFTEKLAAASAQNKTITANFSQQKKVKGIKTEIASKGNFYYDNSGSLALHYSQPQGDKIVMVGENFTIVSGGRKIESGAKSNPMYVQISQMMMACMSGDVTKLGRGWGMTITKEGSQYQVVLTPTEARVMKYVKNMTLRFSDKDMTLDALQIEEAGGGYTHYHFTDKKTNVAIEASVFK